MDFKDILTKKDELNNIYLGLRDKELLSIDINTNPSIIITGETGSGKSILLDQIILQLMNKYTSLEMNLISIDTSGVELNHYLNTRYSLYSAMNDIDKSIVLISKVLRIIEERKELLKENNCLTINEYNKYVSEKLPLIVVAIDDDNSLLKNPDIEKMFTGVITNLTGLNILFILVTSDVHNKFFVTDSNLFASTLISFDYAGDTEAINANLRGSENLAIGEFMIKSKNYNGIYHNFEFDDDIINKIVEMKEC